MKQQEELNKSLEDEIDHLNKTKCNITQELMLEMYNQFVTTNDLVKLGELSDHVNSICNDNEERLEICRILKEKNKFILENMETESRQKIAAKKNILKTQSNEIGNIKNNIISLCEILTQERNPFELNTLKEMKQTCTDDLNLILLENEISEKNILKNREKANTVENNKKEITNTLLKKYEETKSISSAIENENVKSDECLNDLNTKISSVLKR